MSEIKVSLIIPIYNVEKYIEECLQSAQKQTLEEIEIICVNDGSTDASMEIVDRITRNDNRIKVINKANGGASSARNAGMAEAQGKYVFFLDGDDYILPNALEELYVQAEKYELDCIYFDAEAFFETEELRREYIIEAIYLKRKFDYSGVIYSGFDLFSKMLSNSDDKNTPFLQLIRRNLLKEHNITFYEGIIHEDQLFCFRLALAADKVMYKKQVYYMRRVRENSVMTTNQEIKGAYSLYICIIEIMKLLESKDFNEEEIMVVERFLKDRQNEAIQKLQVKLRRQGTNPAEIIDILKGYPSQYVMGMILWIYGVAYTVESETHQIKEETDRIRSSISYRLGKKLTYLPRRVWHWGRALILKRK